MNENINTQQIKPDPKEKAIASFVLGIISVIATVAVWLLGEISTVEFGMLLVFFVTPVIVIAGVVGLVIGISGLRSTKKSFALIGITLCLIMILFFLKLYVFDILGLS